MPAAFTVAGLVAFTKAPPFHVKVLPGLNPVNVAVAFIQFKLLLLFALIIGTIVFWFTVTTEVDAHPLFGLVTVKV